MPVKTSHSILFLQAIRLKYFCEKCPLTSSRLNFTISSPFNFISYYLLSLRDYFIFNARSCILHDSSFAAVSDYNYYLLNQFMVKFWTSFISFKVA